MKVVDQERIIGVLYSVKYEKDMSDSELSKELGMTRQTFYNRRRRGGWLGKELAALADMSGKSMDYFVKEEGE